MNVDFPAPFSPTTARRCPGAEREVQVFQRVGLLTIVAERNVSEFKRVAVRLGYGSMLFLKLIGVFDVHVAAEIVRFRGVLPHSAQRLKELADVHRERDSASGVQREIADGHAVEKHVVNEPAVDYHVSHQARRPARTMCSSSSKHGTVSSASAQCC